MILRLIEKIDLIIQENKLLKAYEIKWNEKNKPKQAKRFHPIILNTNLNLSTYKTQKIICYKRMVEKKDKIGCCKENDCNIGRVIRLVEYVHL